MAHSKSDVWVHLVFCTKYRAEMINGEVEAKLYQEIKHQFIKLDCLVHNINGYTDHIHVLFLLNPEYSIREIVGRVKGGSSYAVNKHPDLFRYFSWAPGYLIKSVSDSLIPVVDRYIAGQKEKHSKLKK